MRGSAKAAGRTGWTGREAPGRISLRRVRRATEDGGSMGDHWKLVEAMTRASAEGRWDDFASCLADDVRAWSPSYDLYGRSAFVEAIQAQNGAFDDIQVDNRLVAESDRAVAFEWTWSIPHPSGSGRAALNGMSAYEVTGGAISSIRQYWDNASFGQALEADHGV